MSWREVLSWDLEFTLPKYIAEWVKDRGYLPPGYTFIAGGDGYGEGGRYIVVWSEPLVIQRNDKLFVYSLTSGWLDITQKEFADIREGHHPTSVPVSQKLAWEVEPERFVSPVKMDAYCTLTTEGMAVVEGDEEFTPEDRGEEWVVMSIDPNPYRKAKQGVFTIMPVAVVDSGMEEEQNLRQLTISLLEWDKYIVLTGEFYQA